jgi:uncharacterized NAD-dependent epimerase/dehydratase family protein
MAEALKIRLRKPYLLLVGDTTDIVDAKTGLGIVHWRRNDVSGQLRFSQSAVSLDVPDMDLDTAVAEGVGSIIVGVAPLGGAVPEAWWKVMRQAAAAGIDVVSGLHSRLSDDAEIVACAESSGASLIDIRVPPAGLPVGDGKKRTGKRILTVGTDCAVGKKYSALSLHAAFEAAGLKSTFRATGQTGIMIAGEGIPIDSVVADFVPGAAEMLSPDNDPDHWDIIEGQGSLFHPAYSSVSIGLLHGSQPDGIVVCHDVAREALSGWEHFAVPDIDDVISLNELVARRTNPAARCVGICVNTSTLSDGDRSAYLEGLREQHNLPAVDPLIDGCGSIVEFARQQLA